LQYHSSPGPKALLLCPKRGAEAPLFHGDLRVREQAGKQQIPPVSLRSRVGMTIFRGLHSLFRVGFHSHFLGNFIRGAEAPLFHGDLRVREQAGKQQIPPVSLRSRVGMTFLGGFICFFGWASIRIFWGTSFAALKRYATHNQR
jgi:hypothetical protein